VIFAVLELTGAINSVLVLLCASLCEREQYTEKAHYRYGLTCQISLL